MLVDSEKVVGVLKVFGDLEEGRTPVRPVFART